MKYNYYMRDTITNDGVLNTVFTYLPGIVLILGGYLFIVFKNIQWNNPLSSLLIIALYLLTIVVSFLITFVMIKMKKSKDKQSIK